MRGPGEVGDDGGRVGQGDGGVLGPQPGAGGVGEDGHGATEGDQLGQLRLVVDLGARAGWVGAVAGPAGERKIGDVADVGQGQGPCARRGGARRAGWRSAPRSCSSSLSNPARELNGACMSATSARPSRSMLVLLAHAATAAPRSRRRRARPRRRRGACAAARGTGPAFTASTRRLREPPGLSAPPARRVRRAAAVVASRAARPSCSSTSPASVKATPRRLRSSRETPRRRSSCWIARDSGGCAMPRRSAARPKCSSSATARKYLSSRVSKASMTPAYLGDTHRV